MKKIPYILTAYVTVLMLFSPEKSIMYARQAMDMCREIIVPSLFPFFVCSGLLIHSGFAETLSRVCRPVMKPLFNINGSGAAALVLGTLSGYPLGALTACSLYESGYLSKSEAERLLAFCNNSGPLFILGSVGTAIYSSKKAGIILYVSHIAAALTVGIIFRFYSRGRHSAPDYALKQPELCFRDAFSQSLSGSLNSILTVCGAVIFFGTAANIIAAQIPGDSIFKSLFIGITELTGGTKSISTAHLSLTKKLILSAFTVGFAGICVHLQVMAAVAKQHLSLKPYIAGKLLHGIIAALYTLLLCRLFPPAEAVFKNTRRAVDAGFCISSLYSVSAVLFLCLLTVLFLLSARIAAKAARMRAEFHS